MIVPADTLIYDTAKVVVWQSNPAYSYDRDIATSNYSITDWMWQMFYSFLEKLFGSIFATVYGVFIFIVLIILLIGLIVFIIYQRRPDLFSKNKNERLQPDEAIDSIYGINFDNKINEALHHNNYYEASRLLYLQTLQQLNDSGQIIWQFYKTPTQYIYEYNTPAFKEITTHFLKIRYGNFTATKTVFNSMKACKIEIEEGNADENP